ncbi:undecaprenyl-diphosphate phosphatase [Streptomyces caniscabiei]|uniref:undecaprenyl-diphosphate phosphatase n=1 Tax=Streptomyces caniscabiei TaxID=2746961 RepID=UPI0029AF6A8D|nr:undecaprenyl-diphosphate phosphatase [Streptomyces caniscabiei]MDX2776295.1 undecaprenyl-diphosphate phosphatase [Streptomyces caniscabiei]
MNIIETIILGLIQGLTEFIPVSSSGHLVLAQQLFSGASDHTFLEFINIGTVLALIVFFRKRILSILRDVFVNKNYTLARNILITAVPAGAVGYFLADFIDSSAFFGSVVVVMVTLAVVGVLMIILEKLPKASPMQDGRSLSPWRALAVGVAQIFALIPGVSRSGSTIIAGRLMGLSPAASAEYSFLVSLPIMLGVTLKVFIKESDRLYFIEHMPMLLVSNLVAFVSGLIAVGFLMNYLSKHSLAVFGWYRVGLAAIIAVVLLVQ